MNDEADLFAGGTEPPVFQVVVYGSAKPSGSKKGFAVRKRGVPTGKVVVIDANPDSKDWKFAVAQTCGEAMVKSGMAMFGKVPLEVAFRFYRMRPAGHTGTRGLKPSAPDYPITRPDLLKLARGIEDALSKVVYIDDSHIVKEGLEKHYGEPERVEIMVRQMQAVGR